MPKHRTAMKGNQGSTEWFRRFFKGWFDYQSPLAFAAKVTLMLAGLTMFMLAWQFAPRAEKFTNLLPTATQGDTAAREHLRAFRNACEEHDENAHPVGGWGSGLGCGGVAETICLVFLGSCAMLGIQGTPGTRPCFRVGASHGGNA